MKTFSILGTGWLGYALALELKEKYKVKVSIKDEKKKNKFIEEGLVPFLLNEESLDSLDDLLETDYLFINFPPSKFKNYTAFLNKIYSHKKIKNIEKIIFISSTSIYPDLDLVFTEEFSSFNSNSKSPKVYDAEVLVKDKTDLILRASGLMGYNRIAGKRSSSKVVKDKDIKINYVHRDDVISATIFLIANNINGIFNLSVEKHPTKEEIYLFNSKKYGFEKSIFKDEKGLKNRIIDGSKIERLGFKYKYSNPFDFI
ncbi:GDP-L-fucose synthase [Poseidonibacter ostreae]|uniref:GDP-L-fucose synthase n=1 Tax=Poseidonibacter ostreae TaxID=2654171 RepID=A0A6L4WQ57_9BACT|nr:GDP-L-fucose synthase [Poseidonibacter ostreae]KAB7884874.1 GDP-L-fucose synthase [Poseidonibacter ostreae]